MKKEYLRLLFLEDSPILIYNSRPYNSKGDTILFFSQTYNKDYPKRVHDKGVEVYRNGLYFDKEEVYNSNLFIRLK